MTTKTITKSSSIRIPTQTKDQISKIAKSQNSTLVSIINTALEEYIQTQNNLQKVTKIMKIQKQIENIETWSAQEEINAIKKSRNNKKL